jgi:hypothetical protein
MDGSKNAAESLKTQNPDRYDDGEEIDRLKAENAALAAALAECCTRAEADRQIVDLLVGREILQSIWRHGLFAPWEAESFEPLQPIIDKVDDELEAAIKVRRKTIMESL